jgi:hypothetical protein
VAFGGPQKNEPQPLEQQGSEWEKTKRKGRCQCHASGDGQGQSQNYGYLFMAVSPLQRRRDCQNRARTSVTGIFGTFLRPASGLPLARLLRQANLPLGEAQPWHLAVGQTCNTQGLEEFRSPHKLPHRRTFSVIAMTWNYGWVS